MSRKHMTPLSYKELNVTSAVKPVAQQYNAFFVDADGHYRDYNIENMVDDLNLGCLNEVTKNNFRQFYSLLVDNDKIPDGVFDNVTIAGQWVAARFGTLRILPITEEEAISLEMPQCRFKAILTPMSRLSKLFDANAAPAPTELCAVLLSVVSVFRDVAENHLKTKFTTTGMMH